MVKNGKVYGYFCNGSNGKSLLTTSFTYGISERIPEKKVLLIDLDFGGPSVELYNEGIIKEENRRYLHEVLEGSASIDEVVTKTMQDNYDLILCKMRKNKVDKNSTDKLKSSIDSLKEKYDHILLDIGSIFDKSSIYSDKNDNDDLSRLIDLADQKFLIVVANDSGKTMSRGLKTVKDYAFYLIKKELGSCLKDAEDSKYKRDIISFLKKDYEKMTDFYNEVLKNIGDDKLRIEVLDKIENVAKNLEMGIIFNQLDQKSDLFYNFITLGKEITDLYNKPNTIQINNMNGYGHFSFNHEVASRAGDKPIIWYEMFSNKTLFKELKNAANFFVNNKGDSAGLRGSFDKEVMEEAYREHIERKKKEVRLK